LKVKVTYGWQLDTQGPATNNKYQIARLIANHLSLIAIRYSQGLKVKTGPAPAPGIDKV
jgi:hypothetical protein